jgi:dolichyl-phosphate-mannose-protein mannosyltransferase
MIVRIGRRLFGSTALGAAAGLLVALDGMHLVMSRTALLDIFLLFFLVAAFGALLLDRDFRRRRWRQALAAGRRQPRFEWRTGLPWWRFAAAALLGAACAVKWSAVFFLPVFALLVVIWEVGLRRTAGVRHPWQDTVLDEGGSLLISAVIVPVVYVTTWVGWFATDHGYYRNWLADRGLDQSPVIGVLQNLLHYHQQAFSFHSGLDASHQYESSPWQWLLLARPVAFHWSGDGDCGAARCASEVLLLGTPLLWWSFLPALAVAAWIGIARRDWRVPPLLLGAAAGLLPWFFYDLTGDRVMFYFYALPAQPFLVLTVVYVLGALMTPAGGGQRLLGLDRRTLGVVIAGTYVTLVALNFAYFYPIYTGQVIPYDAWHARMWLGGRWI